jgi:hypothetical protein
MESQIRASGREPIIRNTLYGKVPEQRRQAAFSAIPLTAVENASAGKQQRSKRIEMVEVKSATPRGHDHVPADQVFLMAACN